MEDIEYGNEMEYMAPCSIYLENDMYNLRDEMDDSDDDKALIRVIYARNKVISI